MKKILGLFIILHLMLSCNRNDARESVENVNLSNYSFYDIYNVGKLNPRHYDGYRFDSVYIVQDKDTWEDIKTRFISRSNKENVIDPDLTNNNLLFLLTYQMSNIVGDSVWVYYKPISKQYTLNIEYKYDDYEVDTLYLKVLIGTLPTKVDKSAKWRIITN